MFLLTEDSELRFLPFEESGNELHGSFEGPDPSIHHLGTWYHPNSGMIWSLMNPQSCSWIALILRGVRIPVSSWRSCKYQNWRNQSIWTLVGIEIKHQYLCHLPQLFLFDYNCFRSIHAWNHIHSSHINCFPGSESYKESLLRFSIPFGTESDVLSSWRSACTPCTSVIIDHN